jgi:aryl-alcohol dehydrogenase-like predicted oxidoreductase
MTEREAAKSRLALGTVQFGLTYGIANRDGQVSPAEAARILACGREHGLDTLDTAAAYGESERRLGEIGVGDWRVVSKLPPLPQDCRDVHAWVERSALASLERLRIPVLYGLLVHRSADLASARGAELFSALQELKRGGLVCRVGASVYAPEELETLMQRFALELVQAPFNIVDRRLETSGWLRRLKADGTEVHTRSVFLQGLLLLSADARPAQFARWQELWSAWDRWLAGTGRSGAEACLGFALRHPEIDRVVIGVDSAAQLAAAVAAGLPLPEDPPAEISCADPELVEPSHWRIH